MSALAPLLDEKRTLSARPNQPFIFVLGRHVYPREGGNSRGRMAAYAAERVTVPAAPVRIQSRAARCAAAISAAVISAAISRRSRTASLLPCMAARLNHLCAVT